MIKDLLTYVIFFFAVNDKIISIGLLLQLFLNKISNMIFVN